MRWPNLVHIALFHPLTQQQADTIQAWIRSGHATEVCLWTLDHPSQLRVHFQVEGLCRQIAYAPDETDLPGARHATSGTLDVDAQQMLFTLSSSRGFMSESDRLDTLARVLMVILLAREGGIFLSAPTALPDIPETGGTGPATPGFLIEIDTSRPGRSRAWFDASGMGAELPSPLLQQGLQDIQTWIRTYPHDPSGLNGVIDRMLQALLMEALPPRLSDTAAHWFGPDGLPDDHPDLVALLNQRRRLALNILPAPVDTGADFPLSPDKETAVRIIDRLHQLHGETWQNGVAALASIPGHLHHPDVTRALEHAFFHVGPRGFETPAQTRKLLSAMAYLRVDPLCIDRARLAAGSHALFQDPMQQVDQLQFPNESFDFPMLDDHSRFEYFHCWIGEGADLEPMLPHIIRHGRTLQQKRPDRPSTRLSLIVDHAVRQWLHTHQTQGAYWSALLAQAGVELVEDMHVFSDLEPRSEALDRTLLAALRDMYCVLKQYHLYAAATGVLRELVPFAWGGGDVFIHAHPAIRFDRLAPPAAAEMQQALGNIGIKFALIGGSTPPSLQSGERLVESCLGEQPTEARPVRFSADVLLMRKAHPLLKRLLRTRLAVFETKRTAIWSLPGTTRMLNDFELVDAPARESATATCLTSALARRQAEAVSRVSDLTRYLDDFETTPPPNDNTPCVQVPAVPERQRRWLKTHLDQRIIEHVLSQLFRRHYSLPDAYPALSGALTPPGMIGHCRLAGPAQSRIRFLLDLVLTARKANVLPPLLHEVACSEASPKYLPGENSTDDRDPHDNDGECRRALGFESAFVQNIGNGRRRFDRVRFEQALNRVEGYALPPDAPAQCALLARARLALVALGGDSSMLTLFAENTATRTQWHDLWVWHETHRQHLLSGSTYPLATISCPSAERKSMRWMIRHRSASPLIVEQRGVQGFHLHDPLRLRDAMIFPRFSDLLEALHALYGIDPHIEAMELNDDPEASAGLEALLDPGIVQPLPPHPELPFECFRQLFSLDGDTLPLQADPTDMARAHEHWQCRIQDVYRLWPDLTDDQRLAIQGILSEFREKHGTEIPLDIHPDHDGNTGAPESLRAAMALFSALRLTAVASCHEPISGDVPVNAPHLLASSPDHGAALPVVIQAEQLQRHDAPWWSALKTLPTPDLEAPVIGIRTSGGLRALSVWWIENKLVVASPALPQNCRLLGLDIDELHAWIAAEEENTLYCQPLLKERYFPKIFAGTRLASDSLVLPPLPPQTLAGLQHTGDTLSLTLDRAVRLPCIKGIVHLRLGTRTTIRHQNIDTSIWVHYHTLTLAALPMPFATTLPLPPATTLRIVRNGPDLTLRDEGSGTQLTCKQAYVPDASAMRTIHLPADIRLHLDAEGLSFLRRDNADLLLALGNARLLANDFFSGDHPLHIAGTPYTLRTPPDHDPVLCTTLATKTSQPLSLPAVNCELTLEDACLADLRAPGPGRVLQINALKLPALCGVPVRLVFAQEEGQPGYLLSSLQNLVFRRRGQ